MSDKLWRAVYDRFHKPQTDPEKKKENVERYHAMVKMMVAIERQNLLQIAEDKNFLNSDADLDSFIDGLETALIISMLVEDDTNVYHTFCGIAIRTSEDYPEYLPPAAVRFG